MRFLFKYCCFYLLLFSFSCQNDKVTQEKNKASKQPSANTLFQLLPASQTKIDFVNTLKEGLNTNVLMYEYFYNGGGVAAGDFNGDDLIDLYFTSNMSENKLYLNKGNWQFEDITTIAKAGGRPGPWKTGVTHADVNSDGKLDIYVCYSGALPESKRQNQLFINIGNNENNIPIFEERAAAYGLNSPAFSNQGYFFDYDKDGDLDMLLLNHNPKSLPVLNEVQTARTIQTHDPYRGLRLFQQTNGKFQDITEKAGISGSALSYGLGLGVADLNQDGWPDFYVSNDYTIPDYLYLNNQDGTFTDQLGEQVGHISQFSMGNDVADFNNDGLIDVFTLDMLPEDNRRQKLLTAPDNYAKFDLNLRSGFHHQYMRNMLQLNNGNGTFSEIGQLAGIDKTDWSWAALFADYDNDGWKDLYVTNGYFRDYTNLDFIKYMDDFVAKKGRLKRADVMELIQQIPASDVGNYLFKNKGDLTFANQTTDWGVNQIANSNGAVYADLDNDGDLDLVVNNINQPAYVYQNQSVQKGSNYLQIKLKGAGKNTHGIGAKIEVQTGNQIQILEQSPTRGYLSAVSPVLHFGLGQVSTIDKLTITWSSGLQEVLTNVSVKQKITLEETNAKQKVNIPNTYTPVFKQITAPITFQKKENYPRDFDRQSLLISELSHDGPVLKKGDFNNDGIPDIFISGIHGEVSKIYVGKANGQFEENVTFEVPTRSDAKSHSTDAAIFDANGDGHQDIYVANGGYHNYRANDPILGDVLYVNDGKGNFTRGGLPRMSQVTETVAVADVDGDGYPDVFAAGGTVPGRYPENSPNYLLINDGKGQFFDKISELAPDLQHLGKIRDAVFIDLNKDEKEDLVVVGKWMPIAVFINENGKLINQTATYFDKEYSGWWNTIATADLNQDGQLDLVVGNQGTNFMYQTNKEEPIELIYTDFDKNGSIDPMVNYYKQGISYPDVTRDELLGQLAPLRSRFTSYDSYADATMSDIFDEKILQNAQKKTANHLTTTLFLSNPTGKFSERPLPIQAQFAPVNAIQLFDFTKDGKLDILLCGNNSRQKLRLGKSDANYGILLAGNGQGTFEYIPQMESGLQLKGDIKSIVRLDNILLFGINEAPVVAYKWN